MSEKEPKKSGPRPVAELVPTSLRPSQTAVRDRLLADPFLVDTNAEGPRLYQHSVLCQTSMPYRDPGERRIWQRQNGFVHLEIQAGRAFVGSQDGFVDVGLPFGPKPRLVLYHLNAEAMRTQSPIIELEDSLTAFVKRTLGLDPGGRNIRTVKEQLTRLSAADFRLGTSIDGRPITVKGSVVEGFDLWTSRNPHQRVLWPTTVQFSLRYFDSLMKHAVPLNETAVARLSHSAMALDAYTWLAQRLHRVPEGKTELVPWNSLWQQFGHGYERVRDFRRVFTKTLSQVKASYPEAKFDLDDQGISLRRSRPPTARRLLPMFPDAGA